MRRLNRKPRDAWFGQDDPRGLSPRTGSTPPPLEEKRRDGPRQVAAPTAVPAKRQWHRAKRPDLTVMTHTADHLPRCAGACSFRISGPSERGLGVIRPARYSGTYWQMPNDEKSGP
jgi:hypothetical protein